MTYRELSEAVSALGFESRIDNEAALLFATRLAQKTLFIERGVEKSLELYKSPVEIKSRTDVYFHTGSTLKSFSSDAKAYSFKTEGEGSFTVSDSLSDRVIEFSREEKLHRGYLYGGGEIIFSGDFGYTVYDLLFIDGIYGGRECDIPVKGEYVEYRLSELTDDFLSAVSAPKDAFGEDIAGASVISDIMRIPFDYSGKIILPYKSAPREASGNIDEALDIPKGCEHLLPLLTASYVWLDDAPEKAQYYMALYREGMAAVKVYSRPAAGAWFQDVTGWA